MCEGPEPLGARKMIELIDVETDGMSGQEALAKPFFSIVIPVYGARDYIAHAIECVRDQSFQDWELIVVDDCSNDGSGDIARSYAECDDRIRVVRHAQNSGPAISRNTGISEASGRYLWMPDSDDSFDSNLLERAYDAICGLDFNPDAVVFGHVEEYFDAKGGFLYSRDFSMSPGVYAHPQEWRGLVIDFECGTHYGYPWNKLYRLDRIKDMDLKFQQVRLIEDITFNVAYFQEAETLVVLSDTPYRYAKRKGKSITNANAYSSKAYYSLHYRRVKMLKDQLDGWGVLDARSSGVLGGLYGRYILSALERNCFPNEGMTHAQRLDWCRKVFDDTLFKELIPYAQSSNSTSLGLCLKALKMRSALLCVAIGRGIFFAHTYFYSVFTKLRSGR